jgi:hypothetical protein
MRSRLMPCWCVSRWRWTSATRSCTRTFTMTSPRNGRASGSFSTCWRRRPRPGSMPDGTSAPTASLFRNHLLILFDDPTQPHPPLLARSLGVDPRIVRYLLNSDLLDERILPFSTLIDLGEESKGPCVDEAVRRRLVRLVQSTAGIRPVIVHLRGPYGVGRHRMAAAVSRAVGMHLLVADAPSRSMTGRAGRRSSTSSSGKRGCRERRCCGRTSTCCLPKKESRDSRRSWTPWGHDQR